MWGGFGAGGYGAGGFGATSRRFEEQYHCYSVAYADKSHLEVRLYICVTLEGLVNGSTGVFIQYV